MDLKRKDTPENRAFWKSVEKAGKEWEKIKPEWAKKLDQSQVSKISDILCLMLVAASRKSGSGTFRVRHVDFQRVFKNSTNPLLNGVIFSGSGPESFSPVLDDSLNYLLFAELTGYPDIQHPEHMTVKSSAFEYARTIKKMFSQKEIKQTERLADEFLLGISRLRP